MDERVDVMTDYQMRSIFDMIITIAEGMLEGGPKKDEFIGKLVSMRDRGAPDSRPANGKR